MMAMRGRMLLSGFLCMTAVWPHAVLAASQDANITGLPAYPNLTRAAMDKVLRTEIERLSSENARLKQHVEHLESDPDTIEHEAREQLHYTRPGEVIYTLDDRALPEAARPAEPGGSAEGRKSPSHR